MIDALAVLIGLFLFVVIYHNKDIVGDKKKDGNEDLYTWFTIFILFLVLGGLAFLLPSRLGATPNMSLLIPFYVSFVTILSFTKGRMRVITQVAVIATFVYVIMGSFM